jgi:hypothetical protein
MDDYKVVNLVFDFARLIQPHPIELLEESYRSRDNINMWSVEHFESLYGGIDAIHTAFYEEYSLGTLARLVMCNGKISYCIPTHSRRLMQVSPASVLSDFYTYGQIIFNPYTGSDTGQVDITDPSTSVGWYEMVPHTGVSMAEYSNRRFEYQSLSTQTHAWVCGTQVRQSLDNKDTKKQFIDYVHRILITGLRLDLK